MSRRKLATTSTGVIKPSAAESRNQRMDRIFADAYHAGLVFQMDDWQYIDLVYRDASATRYTLGFNLKSPSPNKSIIPYRGYEDKEYNDDRWLNTIDEMVSDLSKKITTYKITAQDLAEMAEELEEPAISSIDPNSIPDINVNLAYWYDEADVTDQTKILSYCCRRKQPKDSPKVLIISDKIISMPNDPLTLKDDYQQRSLNEILQELIYETSTVFSSSAATKEVEVVIALLTNLGEYGKTSSATGESATSMATTIHGHHQRLKMIFAKRDDGSITCRPLIFDSIKDDKKQSELKCQFFNAALHKPLSDQRITKLKAETRQTELQLPGPQCSPIVITDIEDDFKKAYKVRATTDTAAASAAINPKIATLQRYAKMRAKQYFKMKLAKHILPAEVLILDTTSETTYDAVASGMPLLPASKAALDDYIDGWKARYSTSHFRDLAAAARTQVASDSDKDEDIEEVAIEQTATSATTRSPPQSAVEASPKTEFTIVGDEVISCIKYSSSAIGRHITSAVVNDHGTYIRFVRGDNGRYSEQQYLPKIVVDGRVAQEECMVRVTDKTFSQDQIASCIERITQRAKAHPTSAALSSASATTFSQLVIKR